MISEKIKDSQNSRAISEQINTFICENLPSSDQCSDPIVSMVFDTLNFQVVDNSSNSLSQKLHNPPAINHDPKKEQGLCF
jgi:hypothetical protein